MSLSLNAQIWAEVGDAGDLVASAQVAMGTGALTQIDGSCASINDVDLYRISIVDFANFSASTVGSAFFDTQLFLFNANGTGQVHNDDAAPGVFLSTIGSQGVFSNGIYYLAISPWNADPLDASSNPIFGDPLLGGATYPGPLSQQFMPTGAGPLASWTAGSQIGTYSIMLTGADFSSVCGNFAGATPIGAGCGDEPGQIYEVFGAGTFDLTTGVGQDLLFNLAGGTLSTSTAPGTAIIPPVAADLGLDDEQISKLMPLGFTVEGICASTISVASNGYIWLGDSGRSDFSESEGEFINEGARLAVYWTDLDPPSGGSIHVDLSPNLAIVTYDHVWPFCCATPELTAQVEIRPDSILVRYDPAGGAYAEPAIVGLTNGVAPIAAPGSVDLSGGAMPTTSWSAPLQLTLQAPPALGTTFVCATTGVPAGSVGITFISIGPALPGIPLAPLTPPGCEQYVGAAHQVLSVFSACEGTASLPIPSDQGFCGLPFAIQSASLGAQILTSNGLDCLVGH